MFGLPLGKMSSGQVLATTGAGPLRRLETGKGVEGGLIFANHLEGRLGNEPLGAFVVAGMRHSAAIP